MIAIFGHGAHFAGLCPANMRLSKKRQIILENARRDRDDLKFRTIGQNDSLQASETRDNYDISIIISDCEQKAYLIYFGWDGEGSPVENFFYDSYD